MWLAALFLAAALPSQGGETPHVLITRVPSRKGIAYRWWVDGKQVASAMERNTGPGTAEMVNLKGDVPETPATEIDSKGRIVAEWTACSPPGDNFLITRSKTYYESGELEGEYPPFDKACERNGAGREYYKSGKLKKSMLFAHNLLEGRSVDYRDDGKAKKTEGSYARNEKQGAWYKYSDDGARIVEITTYEAGKVVRREPLK